MGLEGRHPSGDQVEPVGGELGEEGAFGGDSLELTVSIYELGVCPDTNYNNSERIKYMLQRMKQSK